jgi:hypothetical protein
MVEVVTLKPKNEVPLPPKPGVGVASATVLEPITIPDGPKDMIVPETVICDPPAVTVCPPTIAEAPSGAMVIVLPPIVAVIGEEGAPVICIGATVVRTPPIDVTTPEIVVSPGTIINGVLLIMVVAPVSPGGALATGISVEDGITITGCPSMVVKTGAGVFCPGRVMVEPGVGSGGLIPPKLAIIDPMFPPSGCP